MGIIDGPDFQECLDGSGGVEDRFATVPNDDIASGIFSKTRFGMRTAGIPIDVVASDAGNDDVVPLPDVDIIGTTDMGQRDNLHFLIEAHHIGADLFHRAVGIQSDMSVIAQH